MPKQKTHSGTKKRFKISGTGKVRRRHAMKSHILEKKSSKRKRHMRKDQPVVQANVAAVLALLGKK